jgi:hypothetical protein
LSESNEIDKRVTRLEVEVERVRQDAAASRVLAGGADRDVSAMQAQLRAHTLTLAALRETQVEQGKGMREGFARVEARFAKVEGDMREGFARVDDRFAKVEGDMREGFARMNSRFAKVEGDLREGFASLDEKFASVGEKFASVDEKFARVDERFAGLEAGQQRITDLLIRHIGDCESDGKA